MLDSPHVASWSIRRFMVIGLLGSLTLTAALPSRGDDDKPSAQSEEKKVDRYAIPAGDSAALLNFLDKLQNFRPQTADEFFEHRKKAPAAMKAAAEKILELEKDPTSAAASKAKVLLLNAKVAGLADVKPSVQESLIKEISATMKEVKRLTRDELGIAFGAASALEQIGNTKLAVQAYREFGELFSQQKEELLVSYGVKMLGAARRIELPGNKLKLEGKFADGSELVWKDYRGKVVLVDFWATWCLPCIQELPNVKKNYDAYHKRGFEVVGVSLDSDRGRLDEFLKENKLPWKTLFQDGAGWDHSVAAYYGIMSIPTVILVDKKGKVISLNARGPELGRLLEELLGPADQVDEAKKG